jgi:hypothetical protein
MWEGLTAGAPHGSVTVTHPTGPPSQTGTGAHRGGCCQALSGAGWTADHSAGRRWRLGARLRVCVFWSARPLRTCDLQRAADAGHTLREPMTWVPLHCDSAQGAFPAFTARWPSSRGLCRPV